jgi:hypothetical protein
MRALLNPPRWALRYFALNGTDHRSHTEQNAAIAGYVRWHNIRAQPKVNFATGSPIRTWTDYPAKAAWRATSDAPTDRGLPPGWPLSPDRASPVAVE